MRIQDKKLLYEMQSLRYRKEHSFASAFLHELLSQTSSVQLIGYLMNL